MSTNKSTDATEAMTRSTDGAATDDQSVRSGTHSDTHLEEGDRPDAQKQITYDEDILVSPVRRSASFSPPRSRHFDSIFEDDYECKLSEDSSFSSSGASIDTFGCDGTSEPTEAHKNPSASHSASTSEDGDYELGAFLEMHESNAYDYDDEDSYIEQKYDDENSYGFHSVSGFSVSIMSRNSVPFSIQEERSGDEEDASYPPMCYRRSSAVVSTEQAYEVLADEYLKLMDTLEEVEDMQDRRKSEKSRLTRVLMSKEEEYTERKDRLERMLSRIEKLEIQLINRPTQETTPASEGMEKMLKRSQTEAWEALNNSLTVLEKHRATNRQLIQILECRPAFDEKDVQLYLQRAKFLNNVEELEEELEKLRKEVNHLRGKKKAQSTKGTLIGAEIIVDDDRSAFSIGPLTCHSSDYR
mmetsp:Transcript_30707/g.35001  ORF Transcript_30707/g.35001 Transcript_30707/m.35001 type:complete len:413 (-) Transcript_30707:359-1597(-)|eukprot:CAMPEP_0194190314 /NCGR_PEP_ID=MMETSP0154-20130528/62555_1 /TAXON_ID=1049557 /ORGANISM="Thalassiothrix antarctica, Strain L6-D1" /LENGTH=412 /DNA_ID=CAMNT_0038912169 /DNA_START=58 /DNA_END=1296 /DNA_ORIENTATION=+